MRPGASRLLLPSSASLATSAAAAAAAAAASSAIRTPLPNTQLPPLPPAPPPPPPPLPFIKRPRGQARGSPWSPSSLPLPAAAGAGAAPTAAAAPSARAAYPRTQPPSHKPPELRKSQLLRQYTALLRSTPLVVLFQHNNLRATEWMAVRRELALALRRVDAADAAAAAASSPDGQQPPPPSRSLADAIKIQTVQTGMLEVAMRIVEYYSPEKHHAKLLQKLQQQQQQSSTSEPIAGSPLSFPSSSPSALPSSVPTSTSSTFTSSSPLSSLPAVPALDDEAFFTHALSSAVHAVAAKKRAKHPLTPLLAGPLALLTLPAVSVAHLKAALCVLAPRPPLFAAPTRRACPTYHEPAVQGGVQKLLLLGARVDGRALDADGARYVAGLEGGLAGQRARLVAALQSVAAGLAAALDSPGRALYLTVEGRRAMLEDEGKGG